MSTDPVRPSSPHARFTRVLLTDAPVPPELVGPTSEQVAARVASSSARCTEEADSTPFPAPEAHLTDPAAPAARRSKPCEETLP